MFTFHVLIMNGKEACTPTSSSEAGATLAKLSLFLMCCIVSWLQNLDELDRIFSERTEIMIELI